MRCPWPISAMTRRWCPRRSSARPARNELPTQNAAVIDPNRSQNSTVVLSIDGFSAKHLDEAPYIRSLMKQGTAPEYMVPSFPPVTFPQHYTMATGFRPSDHGLVGNSFWDDILKVKYVAADPKVNPRREFYQKQDVWSQAAERGFRTAVRMWPTCDHDGDFFRPEIVPFDAKEARDYEAHAKYILGKLDLPEHLRPNLIADYANQVDAKAQDHGAEAPQTLDAVRKMDSVVKEIWEGIVERGLARRVTFMIVSDHGFATVPKEKVIQLPVDPDIIESVHGDPIVDIRSKPDCHDTIMSQLQESEDYKKGRFQFWDAKTMDPRFHYSNAQCHRIGDITAVTSPGWVMVPFPHDAAKMREENGYRFRGIHGHDNESEEMRAIFVAVGRNVRKGWKVKPFNNTEVCNLIAASVGFEANANSGTFDPWRFWCNKRSFFPRNLFPKPDPSRRPQRVS